MKEKSNNYGIASLVLGIVSTVVCFIPIISTAIGVLGIIFAQVQKKRFPNGIATAGFITSIIGAVFSVLYLLFLVLMFALISAARTAAGLNATGV